jgi:hypothetical protein
VRRRDWRPRRAERRLLFRINQLSLPFLVQQRRQRGADGALHAMRPRVARNAPMGRRVLTQRNAPSRSVTALCAVPRRRRHPLQGLRASGRTRVASTSSSSRTPTRSASLSPSPPSASRRTRSTRCARSPRRRGSVRVYSGTRRSLARWLRCHPSILPSADEQRMRAAQGQGRRRRHHEARQARRHLHHR